MVGAHVVAGYTLERALPDLEWRLLRTLVASRYCHLVNANIVTWKKSS